MAKAVYWSIVFNKLRRILHWVVTLLACVMQDTGIPIQKTKSRIHNHACLYTHCLNKSMNLMLKGCEINTLPRQEANIRENAEGEIVSEFAII